MKHSVEAFDVLRVELTVVRMPLDFRRSGLRSAAYEADHFVAIFDERRHECLADETMRAADEDFHEAIK